MNEPQHHVMVDGRRLRSIGSMASLGGDLSVLVIAVQVQCGPRVVYEVSWTLAGERKVEWVEAIELQ